MTRIVMLFVRKVQPGFFQYKKTFVHNEEINIFALDQVRKKIRGAEKFFHCAHQRNEEKIVYTYLIDYMKKTKMKEKGETKLLLKDGGIIFLPY